MHPTIAAHGVPDPERSDGGFVVSRASYDPSSTWTNGALALDEWLFSPTRWLAIDTSNQTVRGVTIPSLKAGLPLIGKGRVAAIFGRLREGALAVDIDVPGDFGHFITCEIAGWLKEQGIWHLVRPSGGAEGRHHIITAPGTRATELHEFVSWLRRDLKLNRVDLDLRDAVRPLSSPHRHGAHTRPRGDLREALRSLKRTFPDPPTLELGRPRKKVPKVTTASDIAAGADVRPLALQRWRRDLSPQWRRYLLTGDTSALGSHRPIDGKRSLVEAGLTNELVWAVGDPKIAWQLIRESHPTAMTKAKHRGWSWWVQYVWNTAVEAAEKFMPPSAAPRRTKQAPGIAAATAAARARLHALMWTIPTRSRPAVLLVGHHVIDRILSEGTLRVPCPERDLVKNTGIADRKTIRNALRLMNGTVGELHTECLSYTDRENTSFEFEIPAGQVCSQIPPLSCHPPQAPRGLWATLPRPAHSLWRALLATATPTELPDLAVAAGLVDHSESTPTKSHLATAKRAMVALTHAGLAQVDENGRWTHISSAPSPSVEMLARDAHARLHQQVEAERAAYRVGGTSAWSSAQARALKAQKAKEKAWWHGLSEGERSTRQSEMRHHFDALTLSEQDTRKAKLAEARIRAGLNEKDHHDQWLTSLSPDAFVERSRERAEHFRRMSDAERGLAVSLWTRHRARFGLQVGAHSDKDGLELTPDGAVDRDDAFLERQLELMVPTGPTRRAG